MLGPYSIRNSQPISSGGETIVVYIKIPPKMSNPASTWKIRFLRPLSPSTQTSTSLLSAVKTQERLHQCHNPCSHKRHRKICPCAEFCDAKHMLTSRSLCQIREILCTLPMLIQAKNKFLEATNSVRGLCQI